MRFLLLAALAVCGSLSAQPARISFDQFIELIRSGALTQRSYKVKIHYTPGDRTGVPAALERAMIHLASQGVDVEGKIVDDKAYQEILDVSAERLFYELVPTGNENFSSLGEALGVPNGISSIQVALGKPVRKFDSRIQGIFYQTMVIHNAVLLTGLLMAKNFTLVPLAVLSSYFYQYFANFTEVMRFKGQGKSVVRRGRDLEVEANAYFVFLSNLVEETFINGAMEATIPSEGGVSVSSIVQNSLVFGLAKTSVDKFAANMEIKREKAVARGDTRLAETIRVQQLFVMTVFFNGVVPALRTLALLTEKTSLGSVCSLLKAGVTAVAGCYSVYEEAMRLFKLRVLPKSYLGEGCGRALVSVIEFEEGGI